MSGDPTLKSIDTKLDMFMSSQQRVNESFALAHKDITAALSKSDTQQVEINNLTTVVTKISSKQESQEEKFAAKHEILEVKFSTMHEDVAISKFQSSQYQDIKKMFVRSMIGVFVMFMFTIGQSFYKTQATATVNAEVAALIAEMIKDKE